MHTLKNITTTLIITLLLSFTGVASASIDVNLKTASGVENLGLAGYQQKTVFKLLIHQGEIGFSYDDALGSSVVPKSETRTKKVEPIKDASGPHTTWKTDPQTGGITRHETWTPNPRNPSGWDKVQSTDLKGAPHINKQTGEAIPTPHTQGKGIPGGVKPAKPSEIPRGNHYNY